jgi:ubiquinone/menaquinone biosynthesis C-methylase UbiE
VLWPRIGNSRRYSASSFIAREYTRVNRQDDFDRLFDEAYLAAYEPRQEPEQAEREALAAARLAGCEPGEEILDCPCGYGRHSVVLVRAGYRVAGVDRSAALLGEARRRADGLELELVQADYRELPFPDARFDAVLNLFTSIGYAGKEGDTQALREFRRVLRPRGRLVVETMHRDRLARIFQARRWERLPDAFLIEDSRFDQVAGEHENTIIHVPDAGKRREFPYRIRCYTATELVEMARAAGFGAVACYGGLEGEELTLDTRLVLLAS